MAAAEADARAFDPAPAGAAEGEWGAAWPAHRYGFGGVFALLGGVAGAALLAGARRRRWAAGTEAAALAAASAAGFLRAYSLLVDAYMLDSASWALPRGLEILVFQLGSTCMALAVALVFSTLAAWGRSAWDTGRGFAALVGPAVVQLALSLLVFAHPAAGTIELSKAFYAAWTLALGGAYLVPRVRASCAAQSPGPAAGTELAACEHLEGAAAGTAALTAAVGAAAAFALVEEYAAGEAEPSAKSFFAFHTVARALEAGVLAAAAWSVASASAVRDGSVPRSASGGGAGGILLASPKSAAAATAAVAKAAARREKRGPSGGAKYSSVGAVVAGDAAVFGFDAGVLDSPPPGPDSPEAEASRGMVSLEGRVVARGPQLEVEVARGTGGWGGLDFAGSSPRRFRVSRTPSPRAGGSESDSEASPRRFRLGRPASAHGEGPSGPAAPPSPPAPLSPVEAVAACDASAALAERHRRSSEALLGACKVTVSGARRPRGNNRTEG